MVLVLRRYIKHFRRWMHFVLEHHFGRVKLTPCFRWDFSQATLQSNRQAIILASSSQVAIISTRIETNDRSNIQRVGVTRPSYCFFFCRPTAGTGHFIIISGVKMVTTLPSVVGFPVKLCRFHGTIAVNVSWISQYIYPFIVYGNVNSLR